MTISIPAKTFKSLGAYHTPSPFEEGDDRTDGFFVTIGSENVWISKEDAAKFAAYLTS